MWHWFIFDLAVMNLWRDQFVIPSIIAFVWTKLSWKIILSINLVQSCQIKANTTNSEQVVQVWVFWGLSLSYATKVWEKNEKGKTSFWQCTHSNTELYQGNTLSFTNAYIYPFKNQIACKVTSQLNGVAESQSWKNPNPYYWTHEIWIN